MLEISCSCKNSKFFKNLLVHVKTANSLKIFFRTVNARGEQKAVLKNSVT
jgi:hypothetical protein